MKIKIIKLSKKINKFILVGFLFFNLIGSSQEWVIRYNGEDNLPDGAKAIVIDRNGNIYVTGASTGRNSFLDIVTIKYRPNGEVCWITRFNGPDNYDDIPAKLILDKKGNLYITGTTYYRRGMIVESDFVTLKYDTSGNLIWVVFYDGPGSSYYDYDQAVSLITDSLGNIYVIGQSSGGISTFLDYALIKYDSLGRTLWVRRYETEYWDQPWDIILDDSNNIYITGGSGGGGPTHYDYLTLKYSQDGVLLGAMLYSGPALNFDVARALSLDYQKNIYVTGTSWLSSNGRMGIVTIKYNPEGRMVWEAIYPDAEAQDILVKGNNIYILGNAITASGSDILLVKYNSNGSEIWSQTYNGPVSGDDYGVKIVLDNLENIYLTGISPGENGNDYVIIKYDSGGQRLWIRRYDWGNDDNPYDIEIDTFNNILITGESYDTLTSWDYLTIKYSNTGEIVEKENLISKIDLKIIQELEIIKIEYWLPRKTKMALKFYNPLGKLVKIISKIEEKGNHTEYLRKNNLNNGIYLLVLEIPYSKIIKKFPVLK